MLPRNVDSPIQITVWLLLPPFFYISSPVSLNTHSFACRCLLSPDPTAATTLLISFHTIVFPLILISVSVLFLTACLSSYPTLSLPIMPMCAGTHLNVITAPCLITL